MQVIRGTSAACAAAHVGFNRARPLTAQPPGLQRSCPPCADACLKHVTFIGGGTPMLTVTTCNDHFDLGVIQGTAFGSLIRARAADSDALATALDYVQSTPEGAAVFAQMKALHVARSARVACVQRLCRTPCKHTLRPLASRPRPPVLHGHAARRFPAYCQELAGLAAGSKLPLDTVRAAVCTGRPQEGLTRHPPSGRARGHPTRRQP